MRLINWLLVLPFILLFVGYFHHINAYDQDLGRHLLTGKIILETLTVPASNLYSYTFPTFPFINHHWGSEVIFYLIKSSAGDSGLFLLSLTLVISAFSIIFFQARKKSTGITLFIISPFYLRVLFERTDLRPELFSFLFLSVFIAILYKYREKTTRLIYLLPLTQLLWTNTHIYFPIGVVLLFLFCIDELVHHRKNLFNAHAKTLIFIFILSIGVTLINPHFIEGATYPLRVFQNYGYTIEENQNPFFLQSLGYTKESLPYLLIAAVTLLVSLIVTFRKTSLVDWLLSVSFTIIALMAVRNFPLFAFATFIACSTAFTPITEKALLFLRKKPLVWRVVPLSAICLFYLWQITIYINKPTFGYEAKAGGQKALDFYQRNELEGPIFNNFDIGSYIEYRLYPQERTFIDGRPEAYPASFIQKTYIKMQTDPRLFEEIARKYDFQTIIFSHTDQTPWAEQFLAAVSKNADWKTIYLDEMIIMLVKDSPRNREIIDRYHIPFDTVPTSLPSSEDKLRQWAHFYSITMQNRALTEVILRLYILKPNDCTILGSLASLYLAKNDPTSGIYTSRYNQICL